MTRTQSRDIVWARPPLPAGAAGGRPSPGPRPPGAGPGPVSGQSGPAPEPPNPSRPGGAKPTGTHTAVGQPLCRRSDGLDRFFYIRERKAK
jgi:hypothetical protein